MENSHLCPELFPQEAETEAKSRKEESDKAGFGGGPVGGSKALWGEAGECSSEILICLYTYLDLPKGAKWFLKGVNSPSLRV